jgi:hypothetical protein
MASPIPVPGQIINQSLKEKIEARKKSNTEIEENLEKALKMLQEHPDFEEFYKILQQNGIY